MCDASTISYAKVKIEDKKGFVYLAWSERQQFCKIGFEMNKTGRKKVQTRANSLNAELYGETKDWEVKFFLKSDIAFDLEKKEIQPVLKKYQKFGLYYDKYNAKLKTIKKQECIELYNCSLKIVLKTMQKVASENNLTVEKYDTITN